MALIIGLCVKEVRERRTVMSEEVAIGLVIVIVNRLRFLIGRYCLGLCSVLFVFMKTGVENCGNVVTEDRRLTEFSLLARI